jgi:molybdopterin molybdotransferase
MAKPLSLHEARERVLAGVAEPMPAEPVALEHALGRVLARAIVAAAAWPATDRAAMDGFAVAAGEGGLAAGERLPVVGESLAGKPFARALGAGEAIRIMTGAVVPPGADAVVPVEQTSGFAGNDVAFTAAVRAGQHVRRQGSELAAGHVVLPRGRRIRAAEVGVLAVLGHARVEVARAPRVAIVATGDEVVPIDVAPEPWQVRESNSWATAAQVRECGGEPARLGVAPDEPAALRALLARGLAQADVLVTIGGISKGTHDLVHGTLQELGVRTEFHGIDLKPGKPTYFGRAPRAAGGTVFVFGLPGNPASSFTVFDLLVRPLLLALQGVAMPAPSTQLPVRGAWQANSRLQAIPARLRAGADGIAAELAAPSPSGDPFRICEGDAYALVRGDLAAGGTGQLPIVGGSGRVELP